ncbi:FAD-binding oxidoreductase [Cognatishimia sp. WU-CL00825]|uniref:NAD(P)/FAD-dependent oxidoreductase n=1 Tax=Cognatishimia sp. WU-CL00825 TaxID=3127658 RepID=UPI00310ADE56
MVDVTVMGAGAFGLSVAWACIQRGAKVQVIDPNGVAAGASGGIVGALAPHTPENWNDKKAFQFESLIMARQFWPKVESVGGKASGYGSTGRLQPIVDTRALELAHRRSENALTLWQGKATWQVLPANSADTWSPQSVTGFLIKDSLSARIHPRMACEALAAAILAKGGRISTDAQPKGAVVWATGWQGLTELSTELGRPIGNGVKGQAILLKYNQSLMPQLFADSVHMVPHIDGTVAIGSTSEREFDDPTSTDAQIDLVLARAIEAVPSLAKAPILRRWAGVRPRAKSRAPMLGAHPTRPKDYIANGGFKIGFGMAPKVGEVMADLILENRDTIPEPFKPSASL